MKGHTDINQSKKLAEILPLESADMYYSLESVNSAGYYRKLNIASEGYFDDGEAGSDIPCWSLAALLDVLPYPHIEQNYKGKWTCRVEQGNTTYLWEDSNPIDACVAMVKKLNELNLL